MSIQTNVVKCLYLFWRFSVSGVISDLFTQGNVLLQALWSHRLKAEKAMGPQEPVEDLNALFLQLKFYGSILTLTAWIQTYGRWSLLKQWAAALWRFRSTTTQL